MLLGMNGVELCRLVRSLPPAEGAVLLIVTGMNRTDDLASVLDAGADDYIAKPLSPELLHVRLSVAERQVTESAARRAAEAELVAARAAAAEAAALRELSRQQRLMINTISHE